MSTVPDVPTGTTWRMLGHRGKSVRSDDEATPVRARLRRLLARLTKK